MNLQENIRRILREDKKTKSTNKEFSKYKNSKFGTLKDYTLQDIVDNWDSLSDHKNENIKTIKYFINNPDKITDLVYDEKGLEDGYHRLIAAKILKKPRFSYRLVENLQENIRRIKEMMGLITESTDKLQTSNGGVILVSDYVKNHIKDHNQFGSGSVFKEGITDEDINSFVNMVIENNELGEGGAFEITVPGIGYDLVKPYDEAMSYENAEESTTIKKD